LGENGAHLAPREHEWQPLALDGARQGLHPRRVDLQNFRVKEVERAQRLLMAWLEAAILR